MRACHQCGRLTTAPQCPHDGAATVPVGDVETYADTPALTPMSPPRTITASLLGSVLLGRYRLERELGTGGFGTVFLATQLAVARPVAIKVLRAELSVSPDQQRRFRGEAAAISRLQHPNSIRLIDFGAYEDGRFFLVTEFVEGVTLRAAMNDVGRMPVERASGIARQLLKALDEAHALDIFHRDLKPENVMLQSVRGETDFVKILDFGVAKLAQPEDGAASTVSGAILGTPRYMAPEQAEGIANARTDLYAVGAIVFELLEGRAPFDSPTNLGYLLKHATEPVPPMKTPHAGIEAWVRALLAKSPEDRPASAAEALKALDALAAPLPAAAPPPPAPTIATAAPVSNRATAWAVTALIGVAGAGWSLSRVLESPEAVAPASADSPPRAPVAAAPQTPPAVPPPPRPAPPPRPEEPEGGRARLLMETESSPAPVAASATVVITSNPIGAAVWQDGTPVGTTPWPIARPTSPVSLTLKQKGYLDRTIALDPSAPGELAVVLEPAPKRQPPRPRPTEPSFKPVE